VEIRLHVRFQVHLDDRLGDPIRNGRYAQTPIAPSFFGIATDRTGGGKYVPDDMRFQSL